MKRIVVAIAVASLVSVACAKKSAETRSPAAPADAAASPEATEAPAESAPTAGMTEPDELAELDRLEQALRSEGVALGDAEPPAGVREPVPAKREEGPRTESRAAADRDDDRCSRICALAEAICELETRICTLADEHPGETPYADACARADRDCERASQACRTCKG